MTKESMQTEERKQKNKKFIGRIKGKVRLRTTVIIFFVALFAVTTGTYAWFTLNTFSAVNNLEMTIGTGAQLLVSTEDHGDDLSKYSKVITNEMIDDYLSKYDIKLSEVLLDPLTSDKGVEFFTQFGDKRSENGGGFLEFPIYFIATKDMYVHLSSDNTARGKDDGSKVSTTDDGAKADVVNCPRVSFEQGGSTKIWEPNKGAAVAGQSTFDLPSPMKYTDGTRLFKLDKMTPKRVMVRIWVEGEDPECDDDVQDAHLKIQMCFMGTDENNEAVA